MKAGAAANLFCLDALRRIGHGGSVEVVDDHEGAFERDPGQFFEWVKYRSHLSRGVTLGTRSAFLGVQSGLGQVKALEAAEASSQSALDANKLGYQVGVRINIDVLNSQSQLYQTKRDLAKARYDVLVGQLKLRQAAGVLKAQDLQSINALLAP